MRAPALAPNPSPTRGKGFLAPRHVEACDPPSRQKRLPALPPFCSANTNFSSVPPRTPGNAETRLISRGRGLCWTGCVSKDANYDLYGPADELCSRVYKCLKTLRPSKIFCLTCVSDRWTRFAYHFGIRGSDRAKAFFAIERPHWTPPEKTNDQVWCLFTNFRWCAARVDPRTRLPPTTSTQSMACAIFTRGSAPSRRLV